MLRTTVAAVSLLLAVPAAAQVSLAGFPEGEVSTINLVQWEGNRLPPIYERSAQLPLTDEEVARLAQAGFSSQQLVKIIEERRCACDASADGLIALKERGVPDEVIAAVSLHALRPNRSLDLLLTVDLTGESRVARESYLYVFVEDGDLTRVLSADLNELLARRNTHETMVDRSDILIARSVRRIQVAGALPLKTYGPHTLLVATSARPALSHPSELEPAAAKRAQRYQFDYPRSSLMSQCRLTVGYKRDPVLAYKWLHQGSRFECEWN